MPADLVPGVSERSVHPWAAVNLPGLPIQVTDHHEQILPLDSLL
jgi:hypothetical protein